MCGFSNVKRTGMGYMKEVKQILLNHILVLNFFFGSDKKLHATNITNMG